MDVKQSIRAVYTAAKVGWNVESNWTDPFIFIGLQIIRPLASTLLFPLLYVVGMNFTGQPIDIEYLAYIFIGTAFLNPYIFAAETAGVLVSQDRERYGVMKSIYITSSSLPLYLFGRFLATAALSIVSTLCSILISYFFINDVLGHNLGLQLTNPLMTLIAFASMYLGSTAIFHILPSINLLTNKLHWSLTYYFLGLLYLLGDVIFPVKSLNPFAEPLAYILPINMPLNTIRVSLGINVQTNLAATLIVPSAWAVLGFLVFNRAVKLARAKGLLDKIGWW